MDIQKKDIDELNAVLSVKLTPDDYQPKVDKALKDYRKKATMPGFRQGMVPMSMVKKMVGNSALLEEINKILGEEIDKYIKSNEINILGQPLPNESQEKIDWSNQKDFQFDFDLGLSPDFDLNLEKQKFEKYTVKVDDKALEKQIEDLSKRYGKVKNVDESNEEDIIYGQFVELDDKEKIKEGGIMEKSTVLIPSIEDEKLKKVFVGLKPEQKIVFDAKKIWKTEDLAVRFNISEEKVAELSGYFQLTVEKINRMNAAELNQELFDKIFGKGTVKNEEEFKEKVKKDLEQGLKTDTKFLLQRDIREKLIKELKISLPDEFLKRWISETNEKPITKEEIEKDYENYAKSLKWQLIENKIIKDADIEVSWEDVVQHTQELLRDQMRQYGRADVSDEELKETANNVLANRQETQRLYDDLYHQRAMETIESKANVNEKEISYDAFLEKARSAY